MKIAGAIIAGGQSRRLGGRDKTMLELAGRRMIDHVVERIAPQVDHLAINANGDPSRFADLGVDVLADDHGTRQGPLSGLATMLNHAGNLEGVTHLATVPGDCPFLPCDLIKQLAGALNGQVDVTIATSFGRSHPVIGLWPVSLATDLQSHLRTTENLSVFGYLDRLNWQSVDFQPGAMDRPDPFFNINTPEDLELARKMLRAPGLTAN